MKAHMLAGCAAVCLAMVCPGASAELQPGVRLEMAGKPINGEVGHLVPTVVDWNGDGKKDLIVGQFGKGRIRVYLNEGTDAKPTFKSFKYLDAGEKEIRLPAG